MAATKVNKNIHDLRRSRISGDLSSDLEIYRTIVDRMEQGVLVYDGQHVLAANAQLSKLLDCPPELVSPGASLEDYIAFGAARGDYSANIGLTLQSMRMHIAAGKDYIVERSLPNGRTLRIDCRNDGNFGVGTYTDVTEARDREQRLKEREAEVRKLAESDGLTGLGNRRSFDMQLAKKFGVGRNANVNTMLALVLIDLDRFKSVNDTYGHAMGDSLLQEIARRFDAILPKGSIIARIGGDEFAAILESRYAE
ncbi:MAG: diguanylate cyclase, partial [Pseudomonadota bacterium]